MIPLFILSALAYGAASFFYGAGYGEEEGPGARRRKSDEVEARAPGTPNGGWAGQMPRLALALAAVLHFSTIGAQCVEGDHPFASIFLATSLGVLTTVVGYLAVSGRKRPMRSLGAVLAPIGLVGITLGVVLGPATGMGDAASPALIQAHIGLATLGLSGFSLAAGVAGLYLAMDRRLRSKKFKPSKRGSGMSLRGLERLQYGLMLFIAPIFTLAIVAGAVALIQEGGADMLARRALELAAAGVAWIASIAVLVSRSIWNLRGRKAAWITMIGFLAVLVIVLSYALRGG